MAQRRCIGARSASRVFGSAAGVRAGRTFGNFLSKWTSQQPADPGSSTSNLPSRGHNAIAAATSRAYVELLEDRRLLSSVSFSNGILTIQGDQNASNSVLVSISPDGS